MCGIVGAIGYIDETVKEAVCRANAFQTHRGPDASGYWNDIDQSGHGVAFAHRRLSIIDLRATANQPMVDETTGNAICYNGEVYNFVEIREELKQLGVRFNTTCDTEVVLKAYNQWGTKCLNRLRGMYAFVVWNRASRCAMFARDRMGIKPLYVTTITQRDGKDTIYFASELRALLATGQIDRKLDPNGLSSYLWNGFVIGPTTILRDVQLLPGGTAMSLSPDNLQQTTERYWSLPKSPSRTDQKTSVDQLRHRLEEAVNLRLVSDVPLGVFLSGGVDSSAIAALAARSSDQPVTTFNISFEEAEYDESRYAKAVADALRTDHREVLLTEDTFRHHLTAGLESLDQPSIDGINTFFVSKAVHDTGITVALAGTGGDELFGGYTSFADLPKASSISRYLSWVPMACLQPAAHAITRIMTGRPGSVRPQTRWGKLADALSTRGDMFASYQVSYGLFTQSFYEQLSNGSRNGDVRWGIPTDRSIELRSLIEGESTLDSISHLEVSCFLGERLLRDTDAASMATSLEVRVPLIDHEIVNALSAIPEQQRYKPVGKKQLLRDLALNEIDPRIFDRPKSGFVFPVAFWLKRQLKGVVESTLTNDGLSRSVGVNGDAVKHLWQSFHDGHRASTGPEYGRCLFFFGGPNDMTSLFRKADKMPNDAGQYCIISPCRNEAAYVRRTLDSVTAQTVTPALWIIVDDGSTDDTPMILADYEKRHNFIRVIRRDDRGHRSVGSGVMDAFYAGYETIDPNAFQYICKLDLDLDVPPQYFQLLMDRMEENPRIGTCSGKAYYVSPSHGQLVSEKISDEVSIGASKFYRTSCFSQIGGFVRHVMWDGIDCHRCRMLGWIACSWDDPELRFIHLRPMGSSDKSVWNGRIRHGQGQYFMGTGLVYMMISALYRMTRPRWSSVE